MSVTDALRAVQYGHVVILLMDATMPLESQDLHIASHVLKEGRCLVLGLNKWDQVEKKKELLEEIDYKLKKSLPQAKGIPVVPLVALTGQGVKTLMSKVFSIYEMWNQRISTAKLNQWLKYAVEAHQPPIVKGIRLKFKYATQLKTRPPTFSIFANSKERVLESYLKYLDHELRKAFDFWGVPIRIIVKASANPYEE